MLTGLQLRIAALALLLVLIGSMWLAGDIHGHKAGAAAVKAHWDAAKTVQQAAVAKAQAQADVEAQTERATFNTLAKKYEDLVNAQAPAVADSVAAGVRTGALRLRDAVPVCVGSGYVPAAAVRARAADAAATQALADRTQAAIAAVRAGDEADARERQLDAQVIGLQSILRAERANTSQ